MGRRRSAGGAAPGSAAATVLHHHHRAEDTVLFPALATRQPGVAVTTAELEAQHDELDVVLGGLPDDLDHDRAGAPAPGGHLAQEEQLVLPVWMSSFTADEHDRFVGSLRRATPLRDAGLMISWLLDTAPDGAHGVAWEQVPPSLRLLHRVWWRRRYERAFGTRHPASAPAFMPAMARAA